MSGNSKLFADLGFDSKAFLVRICLSVYMCMLSWPSGIGPTTCCSIHFIKENRPDSFYMDCFQ